MTERLRLRDLLLEVLGKAQKERPHRREADGWIIYERDQLLRAVNRERSRRGKPPVESARLESVERRAVGHSDYSSKYALYSAELVLEDA
jgi:hypothetical protein